MMEPDKNNKPDNGQNQPVTKRSLLLTMGGYLTIFCGLYGILNGILLMAKGKEVINEILSVLPANLSNDLIITDSTIKIAGIIVVVLSLITVLGGGYALGRKYYVRAIVLGGIFASMIHIIFGGIALVLIAISKRDFK